MTPRRIGISGGPGTGKTSLITELEKQGYPCFHEFSRQIIRESLAAGTDVLPWKDLDTFSHEVMKGRLEQHRSAVEPGIYFYDRTIIDIIAYQKADQLPVPDSWNRIAEEHRYDQRIYITPPWKEIYRNDNERMESFEKLLHLHDVLCETYQFFGYDVVPVPKVSEEQRIAWLLSDL